MALITVIVPVYKAEGYLPRCMESILGQSLQDFQLILVSDGSPGPLPPALPELRPADPSGCKPLKRLQNPNQRPRPPKRPGPFIGWPKKFVFLCKEFWHKSLLCAKIKGW